MAATAHPDVIALAARFAELGIPTSDQLGVLAARAQLERVTRLQPPKADVAEIRDVLLAGSAGRLPARVYHPRPGTPLPLVLYLHGGGWVLGSIDAADGPCRDLANASGCVVVSLGYRLAPETPFPGPLEDCIAAAQALIADPAQVGGDDAGLVLLGDSAGGNLAGAAALALRDQSPGSVRAQILVYPCLHPARDTPYASYVENAEAPLMTARELEWFWDRYLASPEDARDPRAAPLLADDLTGLPATTVVVAELDPLRDEGLDYVRRLREAGVTVELSEWAGAAHGFWWMSAALSQAAELTQHLAAAIRDNALTRA